MKTYRSWAIMLAPAAFALALAAACGGSGESSGTPTPEPSETPTATATPEAVGFLPRPTPGGRFAPSDILTDLPTTSISFDHPEGELRWDGPVEQVYTEPSGHCGQRDADFGVPALLVVEDEQAFWGARPVVREDGWRWTGYYHGDWQIWQGDEPRAAYLVHADEERVAFEYGAIFCR